MAWTYNSSLTTTTDQVRFTIGDTLSADPLLQDEEIQFVLAQYGDVVLSASADCCEKIVARLAHLADDSMGKTAIKKSQRYEHFKELALRLRKRVSNKGVPFVGGTTTAAIFTKGMMDYTSTCSSDTDSSEE